MKQSNKSASLLWDVGLMFWILALAILIFMPKSPDVEEAPERADGAPVLTDVRIMDAYDGMIGAVLAESGAAMGDPVFTIPEDAQEAPAPDPERYGQASDPGELQWLLDDAAQILNGQETLFSTDVEIYEGSQIHYYLDRSIFAVTWQQVIDDFVYTLSEVKVSHPSQFRRYLPEGTYDSAPLLTTSDMAAAANAVVATSGDYYRGRKHGITTYRGQVYRCFAPDLMDTCFVDEQGNLILKPAGSFTAIEEAQRFVDENNISFSIAFGPILVDNGQRCEPENYAFGEVNRFYPRSALCQMGELHYLVVNANGHGSHWEYPNIHTFAARVAEFGCEKAYSLDGGQTAAIVMNDELINPVQFGYQRMISDMLYFATALPELE